MLAIDEHFLTRRAGCASTLCDLHRHKIHDVVLGRSECALEGYLQRLEGRQQVRVVSIDLASAYRSLVRKYFPNARIVADRFHVVRLVNHPFLACWRELDPVAGKHRELLSLMRRNRHNLKPEQLPRLLNYLASHPDLELIYSFKQRLCSLLLKKTWIRKQCHSLAVRFLKAVHQLRGAGLPQLVQLCQTLFTWRSDIACMWRFSPKNGFTEGFQTKMEHINRQADGFRNFNNYRTRVKVLCA